MLRRLVFLIAVVIAALPRPATAATTASYRAALTLLYASHPVGGINTATVTLTNDSATTPAVAGLTITLPTNFTAIGNSSTCKVHFDSKANILQPSPMLIPAGGNCVFTFIINAPPLALLPPISEWGKLQKPSPRCPPLASRD